MEKHEKAKPIEALIQAIYPVRDLAATDNPKMFIQLDELAEKLDMWQADLLRYTPEEMAEIRQSEAIG